MTKQSAIEERIREALRASGIPPTYWAVGEYADARLCLVRQDDGWVGGYFERGSFSELFREHDAASAQEQFLRVVQDDYESTTKSVEATQRWLGSHGKPPP